MLIFGDKTPGFGRGFLFVGLFARVWLGGGCTFDFDR
jgi:hypothetical protein